MDRVDLAELKRILVREQVSPAEYRILEPADEGTWCLKRQGGVWLVFYFERGARRNLQRFADEATACEYFLSRLCHG